MTRADAPDRPSTAGQYELYYASGHYDRRYPAANATVLRFVRGLLPREAHLIDFGCGSGRYLMALHPQVRLAAGFDISDAALALLRARAAAAGAANLLGLGPDPEALDFHVARHGPADLILCLFGVLSHIEGAAARRATLARFARLLAPGTGRLVVSVPNRRRRMLREQRAQAAAEIRYRRRLPGGAVELPYKLFDPPSFRAELRDAGFAVERIVAESVFAETMVTRSPVLRGVERLAGPLVPAALGYGLLAVARPVA